MSRRQNRIQTRKEVKERAILEREGLDDEQKEHQELGCIQIKIRYALIELVSQRMQFGSYFDDVEVHVIVIDS